MDSLLTALGQLIAQYPAWTYVIIGIGMALQGEAMIVFAMYLVAGEVLTWGQFFIATYVIVIFYEHFLYFVGKALRRTRFGWKLYRKYKARRRIQLYTYFLKKNLARLLVVAKFVPGMNFLVIALAGWSKIPIRTFTTSYIISLTLWFIGVAGVAYGIVTGLRYLMFQNIEIGIVALIVLIFIAEFLVKKFVRYHTFEVEKKKREEILAAVEDIEDREDFWGPRYKTDTEDSEKKIE